MTRAWPAPLILVHPTKNRVLGFLAVPRQCPVCRRMAQMVVATPDGVTCIPCAPQST